MSAARVVLRPFWTCNACRGHYMRPFVTTSASQLPRRVRRWQNLVEYRGDDMGANDLYEPTTEQLEDKDMPFFEQDAIESTSPSTNKKSKSGKSAALAKTSEYVPVQAAIEARNHPSSSTVDGEVKENGDSNAGTERLDSGTLMRGRGQTSGKRDGISNISNRKGSASLSIPKDLVQEFEDDMDQSQTSEDTRKILHGVQRVERSHQPQQPPIKPMSDLPWYLQPAHQSLPVTDPEGPMAERQKLPEIPVHSPILLQPILEFLSLEIGLDYLNLLDLRRLYPPPALGNNLMMIVGTARSERHLHIGAGRFAAWLRKEHGLNSHADGLVHRNELKIKKRRKAKKARALANAGASGDSLKLLEAQDDGIQTCWICVNAGQLPPHPDAPLKPNVRYEGLIGFGEENNKITLIVQMFTEGARDRVDLEGLWTYLLEKNLKRQARDAGEQQDINAIEEAEEQSVFDSQQTKAREAFGLGVYDKPNVDVLSQDEEAPARATAAV